MKKFVMTMVALLTMTAAVVDNMIRLPVVKPLSVVDFRVGRFWCAKESEAGCYLAILLYYKATAFLHVRQDNGLRWIAVSPLVHISR